MISTAEARQQGKHINTTRMVNHIVSNVEVKIIGQTILPNSTRSSKGKCMPNLKMNKQKENMMVKIVRFHD